MSSAFSKPRAKIRRHVHIASAAAIAVSTSACSNSSSSSTTTQPTLVLVAPENFLGPVACLDSPGAARRYVATIYDVTPPADAGADASAGDAGTDAGDASTLPTDAGSGFPLPSSAPVSCTERAGSSLVVVNRWYAADVQVYDRTDITPLASGSPVMVDSAGVFVAPRWTTSCGRGFDQAVLAVTNVSRVIPDCAPLTDSTVAPGTTGAVTLTIDPSAAGLACGTAPGQVATLRASLSSSTSEGACGTALRFDGLAPDRTVSIRVLGYESGASVARWGTTCTATPTAGIAVAASCDPLIDGGTVDFDVAALLSAAGHDCATELSSVTVASSDGAITKTWSPATCNAPLELDAVPTGDHTFTLTTSLGTGSAGPRATCSASVSPALASTASCQLIP